MISQVWLDERYMFAERYVSAYWNFKRQAAKGNAGAMFRVAEMTERGQGTGKNSDVDVAKALYFKAAEAGDARAQAWLAYHYLFGITLPLDKVEGLRWLRLAADKGNPGARNQLARWYERSDNPERDLIQARSLYRQAQEGKDPDARIALARMLLDLPKAQRDPEQAAALYKVAADDGDPRAMSALSALYTGGVGVVANLELSEKWLEEAFKARDPRAAMMRGDQRMSSASAATEIGDACSLYRRAAERGYAPAQARLAHCFMVGKGWVQDIQRARLWYELAASENDATAMAALAGMAEHGVGQTVDAAAALNWYRLAAQQYELSALERMRTIYMDGGLGQAPDAQQAALWLARLEEARSL
ncbi:MULTISPECIES: tetratricopeptide repeat protein [unclassified Janthinobacterium]|uniref:tetratricopeptide repeat protein n=1 Tax=unclassified Janthinobacterium TaxID=2610881 RepID=UPI001611E972|nr:MULTISPECIES: tetratricopeptide repeat protein [unclassified Janthinobacterium]MBB5612967.1 hypothetical protein [Janthinobacterium sp. S3M3]